MQVSTAGCLFFRRSEQKPTLELGGLQPHGSFCVCPCERARLEATSGSFLPPSTILQTPSVAPPNCWSPWIGCRAVAFLPRRQRPPLRYGTDQHCVFSLRRGTSRAERLTSWNLQSRDCAYPLTSNTQWCPALVCPGHPRCFADNPFEQYQLLIDWPVLRIRALCIPSSSKLWCPVV